jgi:hypothetical protein
MRARRTEIRASRPIIVLAIIHHDEKTEMSDASGSERSRDHIRLTLPNDLAYVAVARGAVRSAAANAGREPQRRLNGAPRVFSRSMRILPISAVTEKGTAWISLPAEM